MPPPILYENIEQGLEALRRALQPGKVSERFEALCAAVTPYLQSSLSCYSLQGELFRYPYRWCRNRSEPAIDSLVCR